MPKPNNPLAIPTGRWRAGIVIPMIDAAWFPIPAEFQTRAGNHPLPKIKLRTPITIVITLEGLSTAPLGCYGCSWNDTPHLDRLASTGVVWDRWTTPTDRPSDLVDRWLHTSRPTIESHGNTGKAFFLTDDDTLSIPEDAFGFNTAIRLRPEHRPSPVAEVEDSTIGQLFASLIDQLDASPDLIWLHSAVLRSVWDSPLEAPFDREATRQEEPPQEEASELSDQDSVVEDESGFELPNRSDVPTHQITPNDDPDLVFAWTQRYAAQIRALDTMVGLLIESLRTRKPRLLIAGTSGFSLGQNGFIGHHVGPLRSIDLRLPLIASIGGPLRNPNLTAATDFPEILQKVSEGAPLLTPQAWCATDEAFSPSIKTVSQRALHAVTTPKWFLVHDLAETNPQRDRLFLKPDDVDDINDVSRLRRDVVDTLLENQAGTDEL